MEQRRLTMEQWRLTQESGGSSELTENGDFHLFAGNGKLKRQIFVCLLKMETENESLFSFVGKR
jgi:hypothetical protein